MALFDLGSRSNKSNDIKLAKKLKSQSVNLGTVQISGGSSLLEMIKTSVALAQKHLAKYADKYEVIRDEETLKNYMDAILENGIYSQ